MADSYVADTGQSAVFETEERQTVAQLVESKLDYVLRVALRVDLRDLDADTELSDLVQEGNLALLQAAQTWSRGCIRSNFPGYARQCIHRAIRKATAAARQKDSGLCSLDAHWDELCEIGAPTQSLVDEVVLREQIRTMARVLDRLDQRLRKVIDWRFGLVDGHEKTYQEIGDALGVTQTRAQQLQQAAIAELQFPVYVYLIWEARFDLLAESE